MYKEDLALNKCHKNPTNQTNNQPTKTCNDLYFKTCDDPFVRRWLFKNTAQSSRVVEYTACISVDR